VCACVCVCVCMCVCVKCDMCVVWCGDIHRGYAGLQMVCTLERESVRVFVCVSLSF